MLFYNWRHTFQLHEGFVRIKFKRLEALGPPPPDFQDRVLVRHGAKACQCARLQ